MRTKEVPYTADELRHARHEVRRMLKRVYSADGLDLTESVRNGWVRDPDRAAGTAVDSRAWATVVAALEIAVTAVETTNRVVSDAR